MSAAGYILVASPFTGPFAWSKVADVLRARGERVVVHGVDDVALDPPVVLVGHSGGGAHLPMLAAQRSGVNGMVLVDALLPYPGRSWAETVPQAFVAELKAGAVDGRLKPWPQWWPEAQLRALLPDDALRDAFVDACPAVPVEQLDDVMPEVPEPPGVFVQLSETYAPETTAARERGWPVLTLDAHHLALLTDPGAVADAIVRAAARLPGQAQSEGPDGVRA